MALTDYEIQESDYTGNDVTGLANRPALTAPQLKARFDALVKNVISPKFNALITALATTVSGLISKVSGGTADNFTSLTSGGEVQDSGYKAADFAAASHVTDTDNPHSVTATQAGALPVTVAVTSGTVDLDDYTAEGTYYFPSDTTTILNIPDGSNGWLRVMRRNQSGQDETIKQLWWRHGTINSNDFQTWVRMRAFGTWSAWARYMTDCDSAGNIALGTGAIGSTSDLPVFTGTDGVLETKTAVDTRTALGLGDSATKDVGTASDEVAAGNHSHTRASLGILTYYGSVTVPSTSNSVSVTMSGLTSSYHAVAMRVGSVVPSTGVIVNSTVCSTNTCTVYFDSYGAPSTIGLYIIATL